MEELAYCYTLDVPDFSRILIGRSLTGSTVSEGGAFLDQSEEAFLSDYCIDSDPYDNSSEGFDCTFHLLSRVFFNVLTRH